MSKKIWSYIIGFLCIIGGVYFILSPKETFSNIVYYLGIVLLITGILKIIAAVVNGKEMNPATRIFAGLVNALIGIILISNPYMTVKLVTIFIGIYLILTSVSTLFVLLTITRSGSISNELVFQAIVKLVLGIIVFTTPIVSIVFTGVIIGTILVIVGIYTVIKESKKEVTYKVKVK